MGQAAEQYERDGYWIADERVAPDDVLEKALLGMAAVRDGVFDTEIPPTGHPGYDPAVLCKIDNPHRSDTGLRGLATCPQIGRKVAGITGARRVQVWASQLLIKPPGSEAAGHVGWHQDRQYWHVWQHDEGLFTAWIALSEVKEDSGPMLFVRGSHRWGFLNQGDFFDKDQGRLREGIAVPAGAAWEEVPALMPQGGFQRPPLPDLPRLQRQRLGGGALQPGGAHARRTGSTESLRQELLQRASGGSPDEPCDLRSLVFRRRNMSPSGRRSIPARKK